jgi:iron complex outermembrane receptor protein
MTRSTIPFTTLKGRAFFTDIFGFFYLTGINCRRKQRQQRENGWRRNHDGGRRVLRMTPTAISRLPAQRRPDVNAAAGYSAGGEYRQRQVLEDQHATSLDEALYNVANVVQTNTLGGTQDAFTRRGFGANRDGSIMTNGLRTVAAQL